ncbi:MULTISPECIES: hypothetical protein [Pontibacillus]|uniref:Spore germination protein GerPA/GerPF n=1 Tax=Pontibacillus chungwhensis TaxID=265426 RepID=A0ABY8UZ46_9BACI|nr:MULTISPECIES: hypothetical protein [Pontibacillus]MCD5325721.1 hypothetical protein [Pontibacillus sp. HN14]WIF98041.1 hypothetical protein QNI29_20320 [Pontibacillus chungwhensis]
MTICFDSINVNSIHAGSGIFVGVNAQNYWKTQSKENYALGTVVGHYNIIHHNVNVIYDDDVVDAPFINTSSSSGSSNHSSTPS